MRTEERDPHAGAPQPGHLVQLFDSLESMAEEVSAFAAEGLNTGEQVLVIAKASHWATTTRHLEARHIQTERMIDTGHLIVRYADEVLRLVTRFGRIDSLLFDQHVGGLVRTLSDAGRRPLRIYGEVVDILAAQGDYHSAQRLEGFWNDLAAQVRFTLLCGYSAGHFGDARRAASLCRICDAHSRVRWSSRDPLASFLLETRNTSLSAS